MRDVLCPALFMAPALNHQPLPDLLFMGRRMQRNSSSHPAGIDSLRIDQDIARPCDTQVAGRVICLRHPSPRLIQCSKFAISAYISVRACINVPTRLSYSEAAPYLGWATSTRALMSYIRCYQSGPRPACEGFTRGSTAFASRIGEQHRQSSSMMSHHRLYFSAAGRTGRRIVERAVTKPRLIYSTPN